MSVLYFMKVDPDWFIDYTLTSSGKQMSESEMEQARKVLPSAGVMGYITSVVAPIVTVIVALAYALYLFVVSKVLGGAVSFAQTLSLTAWSAMPQALGVIVSIVAIAMMPAQTSLDSMMLTHIDPLLVELPPAHPWGALARNFDLLTIWSIILVAIGWRAWGKSSWLQALVVSSIPAAIVYGGMAILAVMR
ncbi:hypothetical protein WQ56_16075 [Luteimonas sp. FCS-9]|nr:hypothetical protein WQ56_16075 [Luteimonas sp. FCS-9]